jgi:hypothetical protein
LARYVIRGRYERPIWNLSVTSSYHLEVKSLSCDAIEWGAIPDARLKQILDNALANH